MDKTSNDENNIDNGTNLIIKLFNIATYVT